MAEYEVQIRRDQKIGDTWAERGAFTITGPISFPGPCPICESPASTCIGETSNVADTEPQAEASTPYPYSEVA